MDLKTLRRDLHAQAARRGLLRGGDKTLYLDFLRENFGAGSSLDLTFRQLEEAAGLLRGSAPALRRKSQREAAGFPPAPFPQNPPAPRRYVKKGKVVSLGQERHLREPASPLMMKKLFAYGFNRLGWTSAQIRAQVMRVAGQDIRDQGRAPDVLTVDGVNRILGSMKALYRHHRSAREASR